VASILTPIISRYEVPTAYPTLASTRARGGVSRLVNIHPSPGHRLFLFLTRSRATGPGGLSQPPFGAGDWTLQSGILHQMPSRWLLYVRSAIIHEHLYGGPIINAHCKPGGTTYQLKAFVTVLIPLVVHTALGFHHTKLSRWMLLSPFL
jgi:hypothetical protein